MINNKLHNRTNILRRHNNLCLKVWLINAVNLGNLWKILRTGNLNHSSIGLIDVIVNRGTGSNQVQVKLTLKTFFDNLHVEKTQKAYSEAKSQSNGRLWRPRKRWIINVQLIKCITEVLILLVVYGEKTGKYHRFCLAVTRQWLSAWILLIRERISNTDSFRIFEASYHIANFTNRKLVNGHLKRSLGTNFFNKKRRRALHHKKLVSGFD